MGHARYISQSFMDDGSPNTRRVSLDRKSARGSSYLILHPNTLQVLTSFTLTLPSHSTVVQVQKHQRNIGYSARRVRPAFTTFGLHERSTWGPFPDGGGCVNWSHVNAIVTVITMILRDFGSDWPEDFKPQATHCAGIEASCRAYSAPGTPQQPPLDWAGVEGQWLRIVCFCDCRYVRSHTFPGNPTYRVCAKRLDQ